MGRVAGAGRIKLKARDASWTCLVIDPLAVPLTAAITRFRWATPNRLTAASAAMSAVAAALFLTRQYLAGALTFQASFILDCMDGKLAMLRGSANALGGFLDQTADGAKIVACSLALAISTRLNRPADAATIIVILLYVGVRSLALTAQISFPAAVGEVAYIGLDSVSPLSVFKAGLRRATRPGTTVDGEAIAFSLAPAIGLGWIGFLVGALLAILEVVWMLAKGIALSRRPADRGEAQPTLRAGPVK